MMDIGAYLPSTDHQIKEYESYPISNNQLRPMMVAGDFHAHIGSLDKVASHTNIQRKLLLQLMDLYPVTLMSQRVQGTHSSETTPNL